MPDTQPSDEIDPSLPCTTVANPHELQHQNAQPDTITASEDSVQHHQSPEQAENLKESTSADKRSEPTTASTDVASASYCALSERRKICILLVASFAAIISPISGSIYFPAINSLSQDLHASITLIDLTISTYLIFQGLAPSFTASLAETYGRRPAYIVCFSIYMGANIGLALQTNFAALLVLRCVQSAGSSGTISLGSAVAADLSTRAERGKYIGYSALGVTLGPALGPVLGGLLDHLLGWRAIFWFLSILCGVFASVVALFLQETCRVIVGNGSVPPSKWMRSGLQVIEEKCSRRPRTPGDLGTLQPRKKRPKPLYSIKLLRDRETFLVVVYAAILYAGYMSILSVLSSELSARFHFNSIQVGLCYLPLGVGSLSSRWTVGRLLDWNFRREAKKQGLEIVRNRQQEILKFDVEKARLAVTIPIVTSACLLIIIFGWLMESQTALPAQLIVLFFLGLSTTGGFSSLNTLNIDLHRATPAMASASGNLVRCLSAAGAVAAVKPLINRIGIGWTSTLIAATWLLLSFCILWVYISGHSWRLRQNRNPDVEGR